MPHETTKGLEYPQRDDKSFIGGYVTPAQKRTLVALAKMRGTSINRLLGDLIDGVGITIALPALEE